MFLAKYARSDGTEYRITDKYPFGTGAFFVKQFNTLDEVAFELTGKYPVPEPLHVVSLIPKTDKYDANDVDERVIVLCCAEDMRDVENITDMVVQQLDENDRVVVFSLNFSSGSVSVLTKTVKVDDNA